MSQTTSLSTTIKIIVSVCGLDIRKILTRFDLLFRRLCPQLYYWWLSESVLLKCEQSITKDVSWEGLDFGGLSEDS